MLDKFLAQLALGIIDALLKRIEAGTIAVDADVDRDRLRRAGSRIDEWLREQNSPDIGGQSNQNGPQCSS